MTKQWVLVWEKKSKHDEVILNRTGEPGQWSLEMDFDGACHNIQTYLTREDLLKLREAIDNEMKVTRE